MQIPIDHIKPNPRQPRQNFDQVTLKELAQSIEEHGVLQPIGVVMTDESDDNGYFYAIQFGERRWRASQMAGLAEIPAVVIDPDGLGNEADILARGLIENIQREDLSPLEVAVSYQRLADLGWTDAQIAQKMGKSRSTIANARRLLTLPAEVRLPLAQGKISERQAQALIPLYKLPAQTLAAAEKSYYNKPADLLKKATQGVDSDELRDDVQRAIRTATQDMAGWPFVDFAFTEDVVSDNTIQAPTCAECPIRVKVAKTFRCPDEECEATKLDIYKQMQLEAAMDASGLAPLDLADDESRWETVKQLHHQQDSVGRRILQQGCGNLRLEYIRYPDDHPILDGFPHIGLACHHGKGGCACLKTILTQQSKNDPAKQEEAAAKRRLEKEVVAPAARALIEALTGDDPAPAFRLFLPRISNVYHDVADWDLEKILNRLARSIISNGLIYDSYRDIPGALKQMIALLESAGLAWPGDHASAIPKLDNHLERIAGWVKDLRKITPTPEQIAGNLSNLSNLANEAQQLQDAGTDEDRAQLAERKIFTGIDELKTVLLALRSLVERGNIDQVEIKHVSWLITVPAGDINFKSHLKEVENPITLDYTLTLMPLFGETKTARQAIEARRRKLEKETEQITTQHLTAVAQELDQIAAHLEDEEIAYLTLKNYRDRLQEIFTTQLDLPGLAANKENNDLLHRWEELVKQVADRLENFQYRKMELPEEPTHE
jgi:ParB/RepB/Spo0J family partition protein